MKVDVVVIGAGMAGLSCARQLQEAGYDVVILEKSRGVGGRVATRRLHTTWADHGVRALEEQGDRTQSLIQTLLNQQILRLWVDQRYELKADGRCDPTGDHSPCYSAPEGMTAIAKWLAQGLTIWRNQRVVGIRPESEETWSFTLDSSDEAPSSQLFARAVVLAIPAPQALALLEPLHDDGLSDVVEKLRQVEFDPCLAAIALYPKTRQADLENLNVPWRSLDCPEDPILAWVGWDSSKRQKPENPVFVIQSNCAFAQAHLDATDLQEAGHRLLQQAAQVLIPWLDQPETVQVHRWRYGFPCHPWPHSYLAAPTSRPLICCGDWCGGATVEQALHSGLAAAQQLQGLLIQ